MKLEDFKDFFYRKSICKTSLTTYEGCLVYSYIGGFHTIYFTSCVIFLFINLACHLFYNNESSSCSLIFCVA